ncbi:Superkiller protein 3, partial [Mycoemilia scoparia]
DMSTPVTKKKLKATKAAIASQDYDTAYRLANEILKFERNYNAYIFLAVASQNLKRWEESEEAYQDAIELDKSNPLAYKGLTTLYEKKQDDDALVNSLEQLRDIHWSRHEYGLCWSAVDQLIRFYEKKKNNTKLLSIYMTLIPGGQYHDLLLYAAERSKMTRLEDGKSVESSLQLDVMNKVLEMEEKNFKQFVDYEVRNLRGRIMAGPKHAAEAAINERAWAKFMVLPTIESIIEYLNKQLKEVSNEDDTEISPGGEDHIDRNNGDGAKEIISGFCFKFTDKYLDCLFQKLSCTSDYDKKRELRKQVLTIAKKLYNGNYVSERALRILIEFGDMTNINEFATAYLENVPHGPLADSLNVWLNRNNKGMSPEEQYDLAVTSSRKLPKSPFAHAVMVSAIFAKQSYKAVIQKSAIALDVTKQFQSSCMINLKAVKASIELDRADSLLKLVNDDRKYLEDAEHIYQYQYKSIRSGSNHIRAAIGLGLALSYKKQYDKAEEVLAPLLDLSDGDDNNGTDSQHSGSRHLIIGEMANIRLLQGRLVEAQELLLNAIAIEPNYFLHHDRLGNVYWARGNINNDASEQEDIVYKTDRKYALNSWVTAAKLNPQCSTAFGSIGIWYLEVQNDKQRAKKCLTKSFQLDQSNSHVAEELYLMYMKDSTNDDDDDDDDDDDNNDDNNNQQQQQVELAENVLKSFIRVMPNEEWSRRRLAFFYHDQGRYEEAVTEFQMVLRVNKDSSLIWEGLADSYYQACRYTPALGSALNALKLDPNSVSINVLVSSIHSSMQNFGLALPYLEEAHRLAKETSGGDLWLIPLLTQEMECNLAYARLLHSDGYYGSAAESCINVLDIGLETLKGEIKLYTVWKLISDACYLLLKVQSSWNPETMNLPHATLYEILRLYRNEAGQKQQQQKLPEWLTLTKEEESLQIPDQDQTSSSLNTNTNGNSTQELLDLLHIVALSASKYRISILPSIESTAAAWHDLAYSYLTIYKHKHHLYYDPNATKQESVKSETDSIPDDLLLLGIRCTNAALNLDPLNADTFNLLSILALRAGRLRLCQHACIQSAKINKLSPIPWANLGFLYLTQNEKALANKAFNKAQMLDPEYMPGWLGQAMLAEQLKHPEAISLFQHCFALCNGTNPEVNYGFAYHSWEYIIKSIKNESKVVVAVDDNSTITHGATDQERKMRGYESSKSIDTYLARAIFAMHKFIELEGENDPAACHLLGLLLELNGEHELAVSKYLRALEILNTQKQGDGVNGDGDVVMKMATYMALTHLARCYCGSGQFEEAVRAYIEAKNYSNQNNIDNLSAEATFDFVISDGNGIYSTLGHGLALFLAGEYEASLMEFENVLNNLNRGVAGQEDGDNNNDLDRRGDIAVLLAQVLWALGTDEHMEIARQQLLQELGNSDGTTAHISGLYTLFAMGLLNGDPDLLGAVHAELSKIQSAVHSNEITQLSLFYSLLYQGTKEARVELNKAIHKSPSAPELWIQLSTLQLVHPEQEQQQQQQQQQTTASKDYYGLSHSAAQNAVALVSGLQNRHSHENLASSSSSSSANKTGSKWYLNPSSQPASNFVQAYLALAYSSQHKGINEVEKAAAMTSKFKSRSLLVEARDLMKKARRAAQRAIHLEPWNKQAWQCLGTN